MRPLWWLTCTARNIIIETIMDYIQIQLKQAIKILMNIVKHSIAQTDILPISYEPSNFNANGDFEEN